MRLARRLGVSYFPAGIADPGRRRAGVRLCGEGRRTLEGGPAAWLACRQHEERLEQSLRVYEVTSLWLTPFFTRSKHGRREQMDDQPQRRSHVPHRPPQ